MRFVADRGAVAELLVRAAGESSWPGRRGGAAGTGSQRKQLAGAPREGWSEAEVCAEKLAAGRATPLRQREGAEQHREEAKWQQSALYSIFIPVPQAPYCHTYHNKIQQRCVILRYRERKYCTCHVAHNPKIPVLEILSA